YVMEQLKNNEWSLGGESSGHIVCLDKTTTGDGIVSALQVLSVMVSQDKTLADLKRGMSKLPQTMINVRLPEKKEVVSIPQVQDVIKSVEETLAGRGRVLLRPSGTEPLIRVMVEGDNADEVAQLCRQIADVVEEAIQA
ncbi:MAG: phosphoglucosamine mutase, partial [Pseudomonadales bacterium]|nr:phosphoglucosamine mutase [Pseudomonadales bacterium]